MLSIIGIKQLRFKPAYNPYTEPSMEIFSYHEGLKKWVEIGNTGTLSYPSYLFIFIFIFVSILIRLYYWLLGVFRPEMLLPMGLPENVRVIAWGLSLEL